MISLLSNFLVANNATLKDGLTAININCKGICFVVDQNNKLIGTLTDGDIRRALLKGASLEDSVIDYIQKGFISFNINVNSGEILASLSERIKVIPLVDDNNVVVDYATINKLRRIPVANTVLDGNELSYVSQCIKSSWISSQGKYVDQFERMFTRLVGQTQAVAVSNGTVALQLSLLALGIGPGDEVIIPDLTFAATINAVIYVGATPVLADVDIDTWGLSLETILPKVTKYTKAILPVHLYGHPCDIL
ncbi:MAG: aminotransferase class I/II-fold pyridoxal phosphate-dependent enzyme, partial [Bacteroidota bacterium]